MSGPSETETRLLKFIPQSTDAGAPVSPHMLNIPIKVLIAEPDPASRKLICSLVEYEPEMMVECVDDSRLVATMQENAPDVVIFDAHILTMRRAGSWDALGIAPPPATIVTAYDPTALTAFACMAIDLLVKPIDAGRLENALALAKSKIVCARAQSKADEWDGEKEQGAPHRQFLQRLAVEADERIMLVRVEDIHWMQSAGNWVRLHIGNRSHLLRQSMKNLQAALDPNRFLRVHRNAIVNLDHVQEFYLPPSGNMFVKLNNGMCLPLRKANRATLRKLLKQIA